MAKEIIVFTTTVFNKGFEFAQTQDGKKVFCHKKSINNPSWMNKVMTAEIVKTDKGYEAKDITPCFRAIVSQYLKGNTYVLPKEYKAESSIGIDAWLPWAITTVKTVEEIASSISLEEAEKLNIEFLNANSISPEGETRHCITVDGTTYSCVVTNSSRRFYRPLRWR